MGTGELALRTRGRSRCRLRTGTLPWCSRCSRRTVEQTLARGCCSLCFWRPMCGSHRHWSKNAHASAVDDSMMDRVDERVSKTSKTTEIMGRMSNQTAVPRLVSAVEMSGLVVADEHYSIPQLQLTPDSHGGGRSRSHRDEACSDFPAGAARKLGGNITDSRLEQPLAWPWTSCSFPSTPSKPVSKAQRASGQVVDSEVSTAELEVLD